MRTTLIGAALGAALAFLTASAGLAAAAVRYDRPCSGTLDTECHHDFCGIEDCVRRDCVVYTGALGEGNAGVCAGTARQSGGA